MNSMLHVFTYVWIFIMYIVKLTILEEELAIDREFV